MKQARIQRRHVNRTERDERRAAERHQCRRCALKGDRDVPATHGELCRECFDGVTFVRKW